ncbi:MAG: HAMP domain-containing histidine kinase [Bacteroidetes bacterium]|nr:HAMP domain-containing histidine kinase [Bacteroidota bacterium]
MKIRHKISLLFALQVMSIMLFLGFAVYYFSSLQRERAFYKRLRSRANYSAQLFSFLGRDSSNAILTRNDSTSLFGPQPVQSVAIFSGTGELLYKFSRPGSPGLVITKEVLNDVNAHGEKKFRTGNNEAVAIKHNNGKKTYIVAVAAYDEDGLRHLDELAKILGASFLAGILITALIGFIFSRQLVKPILQIIHEVNDISSYNLSHRIKIGSSKDELAQLANTFNELLERLQKSFNTQRRFISNASHELSTPLTSISSQLEVTLQKERNSREYEKVLASISEDVLQMRQLTKSLLEIAKADTEGNIELKEVRIDEILLRIISEIRKINQRYHVDLYFEDAMEDESAFIVFGNVELLHSALKNIIENGCKYSVDKTSRVDLLCINNRVCIHVMNKGNVIAAEELQKIFQPFYRGVNSKEYKGFGLGLALAKSIARLHRGVINVQSGLQDGTIFTIEFPSLKAYQ